MRAEFWEENLKVECYMEHTGVDNGNNIKVDLRELRCEGRLKWLRIRFNYGTFVN
jgi:hypothetical protein